MKAPSFSARVSSLSLKAMACSIALLTGSGPAEGAERSWSYTQSNWSASGAWNAPLVNGDSLLYTGGPGTSHNDIGTPLPLAGIRFSSTAQDHLLTGNGVTLSGPISSDSSGTQELRLNLALSAHQITTVSSATGRVVLSGVLSGAYNVSKQGAGTLVFTNHNTYTGTTTLNDGTLLLDFSELTETDPAHILAPTSALHAAGGELQMKGKGSGTSTQNLASLTLTAGLGSRITLEGNGGAGTSLAIGTLTRESSGQRGGTTLSVNLDSASSITLATPPSLTHGILGYVTVRDSGGVGFATIAGNQLVRYTGSIDLPTDGGSSSSGHYRITGSASTSAASSLHSLEIAAIGSSDTLQLGGNLTVSSGGGILISGAGDYTISNHSIRNLDTADSVAFHIEGEGSLTLQSNLQAVASSQWAKAGRQRLILAGTQNSIYNAATTGVARFAINEGVVQLNQSFEGMHFFINTNDGLQFGENATAITIGALAHANVAAPRRVKLETVTGEAVALTLGRGEANFNGSLYGSGSLIVTGGRHSFSGTHTYTGGTVIDGPAAIFGIQPVNGLSTTGSIEIRNGGQLGTTSWRINQTTTGEVKILNGKVVSVSGGVLAKNGGSFELHQGEIDANVSLRGTAGLIKKSTQTFTLGGVSQYTGETHIEAGTLMVDGSIASSNRVIIDAGGTIAGRGVTSTISGAGLVSPGNSAGILTAPSVDGTLGLDFHFEMTQAPVSGISAPSFAMPSASGNDLLRLTSSTPFLISLGSGNQITLDFRDLGTAPQVGEVYLGGFYSDSTDFSASIANADFAYLGLSGDLQIEVSTIRYDADFGTGTIAGYITQFEVVAIPEPGGIALGVLGGFLCIVMARKRRRN